MALLARACRSSGLSGLSVRTTARLFSSGGIRGGEMGSAWKDRERAAEELYFSKEDASTLARLAAKLHEHTSPTDTLVAKEREELVAVLGKHGVPAADALVEDLLKFKFNKA